MHQISQKNNTEIPKEEECSFLKSVRDNSLFQKLIENCQDGLFLLDNALHIIYRNAAAERIIGWDKITHINKQITDLIYPDDKLEVKLFLDDVIACPGRSKGISVRFKHVDGHFIWLDFTFSNFLNDPDFNAIICYFRDTTKEKHYAEHLEYGERKFRALVENTEDGIAVLSANSRLTYVSPAYLRILGYENDDIERFIPFELVHPDDLEYVKNALAKSIGQPGIPLSGLSYRAKHKDGHWVLLGGTLTNLLQDSAVGGLVSNFRDITEEKELQNKQAILLAELKKRNEFIETILQNLPIGIAVNRLDDGKATFLNQQFTEIYGWPESDIQDVEGFLKRIYPDKAYANAARIIEDIESHDPGRMIWKEVPIITQTGEQRFINAKDIPLYDQNLMISTVLDVTHELKQGIEIRSTKANNIAIINSTDDLIWSVDTDMCITVFNDMYREFVKVKTGKLINIGDSVLVEGYGEAFLNRWKGYYECALNGKKLKFREQIVNPLDGITLYGLVSLGPIYNDRHEILGAACYVKDITEDSLNIIALERTKDELEKIMSASLDIICSVNKDGTVLRINAASEKILGYSPAELIGKTLFTFIHPDDKEGSEKKAAWLMNDNDIVNFENRYIRKDGSIVHLSWTSKWDETEQIRYGVARDITEKKKSEAELIESENNYRNLFENNPVPFFLWEFENLRFMDCNKAALEKYGYSKEEFLRLRVPDLWPDVEPPVTTDDIIEGIGKDTTFKIKRKHKKKNGEIIQADIRSQFVTHNGKQMALAMVNDITEAYYYSELDRLERDILEKSARSDQVLSIVLSDYLNGMELLHPGMSCSILENRNNKLYVMASSGLEDDYLNEIDGSEFGEKKGPCGKAAILKQKIIFPDIQNAELSAKYKKIADNYGLKSCWSHPILDANSQILAVFACYYKFKKHPTELEQKTIERAVNILQVILESRQRKNALKLSNTRFERATEATFDVIWDWDFESGGVHYSENFKKLFGHEAGLKLDNLDFYIANVHPDDLDRVLLQPDEVKYGTMTEWAEEYRFKKSCGEYAFVRDRAVVIRDENGMGIRMIGAMQNITKQKLEEQHLKLLESVVTNTNDAVLISEAASISEYGPEILYVNEAFTRMTGYEPREIVGKTAQKLIGEKTDKEELKRCAEAISKKEPFEGTIINYKKNGDVYWKKFSIKPVFDEAGTHTHWIAIEHDITDEKNEELQRNLLAEIGSIFDENIGLKQTMNKVLRCLVEQGNFSLAEFWLIDKNKNTIGIEAQYFCDKGLSKYANNTLKIKGLSKGEGFPGVTWQTEQIQYWNYKIESTNLRRYREAAEAGIKRAYSLPLFYKDEIIGTLAIVLMEDEIPYFGLGSMFNNFSKTLGAEIKRKQLEEELTQVFTFTPDILCIADIAGYFRKINPAMSTLLEYSEQELLSIPYMELIYPEDQENTVLELNNIKAGKPCYYIENRYITKSGKLKWLAWTTTGASENGMLYCVAKDITEKKELQELLSKATRLARIGAWELDLNTGIVHWSDITREIHEADPGFVADIKAATIFYREDQDRERITKTMKDAINFGTPADLELQITTAKGNNKWVRVIVETEFSDGKCIKLYGSFQDIDARKKAEINEINALEERNTILESIGDAFFAVDKNWLVTYWNKMAEKVLSMPRNKIINRNFLHAFPDWVGTEAYHNFCEAIRTGVPAHFEQEATSVNGWLETSVYPTDTGLTVYIKDITERKLSDILLMELNESLQKQAKELAISNAELEQFAYVASHDLQEPLRMVTSFMAQLEKKYGDVVDEKGKQYIHFAVDGAKRMKEIILDLLDFSRIGNTEDDLEEVDFNHLAEETIALYRKKIEDEHATVSYENLPTISTFKTPIKQVFQNLISNGLKYHKSDVAPIINISCKETSNSYQFAIKDNGIGIAPEYFDKIFLIFQRLHNKDEYSGTGMGLAITKKVIENYGGKIWVESKEGEGSTFYFTLLKNEN